ncbi:MAG TPA: YaeQ family protein [Fluviicoccus sp.]|nr:YaeQ family protein [Fluviicoccus sp.]
MAVKSTIFKVALQVSDLDRDYYAAHALTIARHPSETDMRMMLRVVAFALYADEALEFTRGLSSEDEPDIWRKNLRDEVELWIDLGQPDEKRIRKACGRSQQVVILTYGGSVAEIWWKKTADKLARFDNLTVLNVAAPELEALGAVVERTMQIQCTIDHSQIWLTVGEQSLELSPATWKKPA